MLFILSLNMRPSWHIHEAIAAVNSVENIRSLRDPPKTESQPKVGLVKMKAELKM